jgi:hypothetical protein
LFDFDWNWTVLTNLSESASIKFHENPVLELLQLYIQMNKAILSGALQEGEH